MDGGWPAAVVKMVVGAWPATIDRSSGRRLANGGRRGGGKAWLTLFTIDGGWSLVGDDCQHGSQCLVNGDY